ncbi:D-sedoheptulose 7-phosphate isomerase [Paucidesulfovibrio gracilis DSM 16080]|uniref:Phosphoheptose isomerase n=1 Tax=Paucidesulfovibrio gracilis DSM 16080 TaxID=1121449 RepID=A0A1T4W3I0_9BACT|nr:D-sedoheptulose 7-phosphate isomerase [Paucidesulfovibrio gracilis]SKA71625.1 D-sedoheptulose 7-phosphate isomerase [Paucidesulfovibrio gracilis DSM 16080]
MSITALEKVRAHAEAGQRVREAFFQDHSEQLVETARTCAVCLAKGGKLLLCGNGGSAADSQHLAAEFVNRFKLERPPLPAIALTTDTSIITATGNDYSFTQIFEKQVQALGNPGDILLGISTSGSSPNVLAALREARRRGMVTIGLTGERGGEMIGLCDTLLAVPSPDTAVAQELHIAIGHVLCLLVDHFLFESVMELNPYLQENEG